MLNLWNDPALTTGVRSRSINAENPSGRPSAGALAASALGPGRKGSPASPLPAGGTLVLADIEGPGVIRHLWLTVPDRTTAGPFVLRDLVLRMYWDDEDHPSVEVPLGDFFCNGFATRALVTSVPIVVAPSGGMNCYFTMPFRRRARIELSSDHPGDVGSVYYQVDYTIGDAIAESAPYFHAQWRRSNADTAIGEDHLIVDGIRGSGCYLGTYIALASLQRYWWGEGEVKFFLDDETDPTLCSTGLEDYAGGAWAFQDALRTDPEPTAINFSAPFCGYPFTSSNDETHASPFTTATAPMHGLYRWHLPDPIFFSRALRVTLQQIGAWDHGLFERTDDISTTAYWYQSEPHRRFADLPDRAGRTPR
ncbi:MAG TPA: glycoside hydrolase family 172 protein [Microlunatus sp.]